MKRLLLVLPLLLAPVPASAQGGDELGIVPLVNPDAPLLAVWFVAHPGVSLEDATAVENQLFEELLNRRDIRLMGRDQVIEKLSGAGGRLAQCRGEDDCLLDIARTLQVERLVGVVLSGQPGEYRVELRSFLLKKPPRQLNSVAEGSLKDLLTGGLRSAVRAIFENTDAYARVVEPPPPAPTKTGTPETRPATQAETVPADKPPAAPSPRPVAVHVVEASPETPPPQAAETPTEAAGVQAAVSARPGFLRRHLGSAISLGVGVACLGTGIALGTLGQQIADDMEQQYDPDRDSAGRTYTTTANVMFGLGGAAALTAVVLFLFFEDGPEANDLALVPATGGLQVLGRF